MKRRKIFEEGKYIFSKGEEQQRSKRETIFGEGKYIFVAGKKNREGKGGKYLEKEIIWSAGGQDGPGGPDGPSGQP